MKTAPSFPSVVPAEASAQLPDPRIVATVMIPNRPPVGINQTVTRVTVDRVRGIVCFVCAPGGWVRGVAVAAFNRQPEVLVDVYDQRLPGLALRNAKIEGQPLLRFALGCLEAAA